MRPGPRIWASNAVWVGGPDVAVTTKVPMSAAELADGRYRSVRPSSQLDNYELWAMTTKLQGAGSMRLLNLTERFDLSALGGFVGGRVAGCWDPLLLTANILEERVAAAAADMLCIGGLQPYALGAGFAGAPVAAATAMRVAIDPATGNRAAVLGAGGAGEFPWHSTGYANFVQWPGGAVARAWTAVVYTVAGGWWVFAEPAAGLIYRATGVGIASAPFTPPGWGATASIVLAASNHAAADVYPDDPGNDCLVAMTDIQASFSTDGTGNVWSAAAAHGLGAAPDDVAYSKVGGKFLAILVNGHIAESLDNGATWTDLGMLPIRALGAASFFRLATDGYGDWVAMTLDAGDPDIQICASWDDGATWTAVHLPSWVTAPTSGCVFYGGGQFHVVTIDAGAASYVYTTLRAEE